MTRSEEPAGPAERSPVVVPMTPRRQWAALAVLLLPVLIISIDNTVIGFAIPELSEDLAPTSAQLLWIVDIYAFVLAGLLVTMGTLGDRIGRRRLLMLGAVGFGAASTLAAFAPTAELLIVARALLGFAGATLMPSTLSLLRNIFDDATRRRVAIGIWNAGFAAGAALGPILGGWLLEHRWWGSVFLMNLPVMAVLLVLAPLLLPESRASRSGRFDLPSSGLSLLAILPIVYAIKTAAGSGPTPALVGLVAVGVGFGVAFVRRQRRLDDPMLDVTLFSRRSFSVAVGTNLLGNFALIGSLFFVAQYLQVVLGVGPLGAGLHLLPGMLASMVASVGVVAVLRRGVGVHLLLAAALATTAAGFLTMLGVGVEDGGTTMMVAMLLLAGGIGAATSLGANLVMAAVPAARAGAASAVSETSFELGAALGTAVLGSVVTAVYRRSLELPSEVPGGTADAVRETLGGAVTAVAELPVELAGPVLETARAAFTSGVHAAAVLAAVLLVTAAVVAGWTLRRVGAPASWEREG